MVSCIGGRIAVTPFLAHQRIERSEEAKGWKIGGCGFCSGLGTTPTALRTPPSTPLPHLSVASSVHGVSPGGIFQYWPWKESISSVQAFLMMAKHSSNAARLAASM